MAAETRMNLSALQQRDPYITGIVDTASQVALYSFNSEANEWEKTDVEGTLFVYTRSASPVNGFLILNRLGLNNDLTEPINKNLEFQLQDPFLLYRNGSAAIFGIWFYDKDECARIGQLMNSLAQIAVDSNEKNKEDNSRRERRASESEIKLEQRGAPAQQKVQVMVEYDAANSFGSGAVSGNKNINIMDMLSKARDEYDKSEQRRSPTMFGTQDAATATQPNAHIMQILAKAKAESDQWGQESGAQQNQESVHDYGGLRESPKSKGKGKTPRKHAPKPMIDNPNAAATKATDILRPLPLKPNSSTGDLEENTTTSITLDALFKSTKDDKKMEKKSVSPQPLMGLPPLLQRIMSQPGSSMLEDIERQSYPQSSSYGAEALDQLTASNGASVPKMPSPPKTVSAKWTKNEPESPNTIIKRSLNMLGDQDTASALIAARTSTRDKSSKHTLARTISTPAESNSAQFWHQNVHNNAVASAPMGFKSQQIQGQTAGLQTSHVSPQNSQMPMQSTPTDSMSTQLRYMNLSHDKVAQGPKEISPLCAGDTPVKTTVKHRPEMKVNTSAITEEAQPELITPQALLDKSSAFPGFSKSMSYSSSQICSDSSTNNVLMTPMAFENTRATPPLNPVQLTDIFMHRTSISADAGIGGSLSSAGSFTKDRARDADPPVNALTKQQLQQALVHLLKTDPHFLTAIHEGYVMSLHQELRAKSERL